VSDQEQSMEDIYRAMAAASKEEQLAQVDAQLAHMASLGYDKIVGPILQMAKATALPGKRDELLEVLKQFQPIVSQEEGTLFYGHFPDVDDPDVVHSIQVYEDWDTLAHHMRDMKYNQFVVPVMSLSAPGSPVYSFASCLFMHKGKGRNG
jgi:quinol monooxygenase YgiN